MPHPELDTCCQCGRAINLKDYRTYRVRDDYRLMCVDCSRGEKPASAEPARKAPASRPDKKNSER